MSVIEPRAPLLCEPELRSRRGQAGFTLIELMVAILVSGIVLMGVFAFASIQKDTAALQRRQIVLQQALEGSMHSLGADLRMAGLGFGRSCSEVRIWSPTHGKLINPGAMRGDELANVYVDGVTGEPLWVLRDGIQAHWRSAGAGTFAVANGTSASPDSAADSVEVFRGELNMAPASGVFEIQTMPAGTGGAAEILFQSSDILDNGNNMHVDAVRQMFPPGSFVLVVPVNHVDSYVSENQGQCALVQVTGEIEAEGASSWTLPVGDESVFNANLEALLGLGGEVTPNDADEGSVVTKTGLRFGADWDPQNTARFELVPLGRARWSRYEIDYTVATRPMLVRSDIIGWREGDPKLASLASTYPSCPGGECRLPTLYLPGADVQPPRVAIGPMIEDMQVAVGCDGWDPNSTPVTDGLMPPPDSGYEEKGPGTGPLSGLANRKVDERDEDDDRGNDEWLGNAASETWGPDCVSWGTAERNAAEWDGSGLDVRMSPQIVRVTLLARPDTMASGSDAPVDAFYQDLVAIEDRNTLSSDITSREYRVLTERFRVRNSHWRDPALQ